MYKNSSHEYIWRKYIDINLKTFCGYNKYWMFFANRYKDECKARKVMITINCQKLQLQKMDVYITSLSSKQKLLHMPLANR